MPEPDASKTTVTYEYKCASKPASNETQSKDCPINAGFMLSMFGLVRFFRGSQNGHKRKRPWTLAPGQVLDQKINQINHERELIKKEASDAIRNLYKNDHVEYTHDRLTFHIPGNERFQGNISIDREFPPCQGT